MEPKQFVERYLHPATEMGVMKVFLDYRIFDNIPEEGDISISDLASKTGAQSSLLHRFSNFLIASDLLVSPGPGRVSHTAFSKQLRGVNPYTLMYQHFWDYILRPAVHWPEYFAANGLAEPKSASRTPVGLSTGHPDKSIYEYFQIQPQVEERFNRTMAVAIPGMPSTGMYDFAWVEKYAAEGPSDRVLIVDVAGGMGQALRAILEENEQIPAERCVLVDRDTVIQQAEQGKDDSFPVQTVAASFFDEQPVKGALIYHIRRALNDWPDEDAVTILGHLRAACAPDSRVLVSEQLFPAQPSAHLAALDLFFMNFAGKRRTEADFHELAGKTGLKVTSISRDKTSDAVVIEMVPV